MNHNVKIYYLNRRLARILQSESQDPKSCFYAEADCHRPPSSSSSSVKIFASVGLPKHFMISAIVRSALILVVYRLMGRFILNRTFVTLKLRTFQMQYRLRPPGGTAYGAHKIKPFSSASGME
jgi:hypothetical protein